jgi:hypothetical protein
MTLDDSPGELRDSGEFFWRGFGIDAGGGPGVSSEKDITGAARIRKEQIRNPRRRSSPVVGGLMSRLGGVPIVFKKLSKFFGANTPMAGVRTLPIVTLGMAFSPYRDVTAEKKNN